MRVIMILQRVSFGFSVWRVEIVRLQHVSLKN